MINIHFGRIYVNVLLDNKGGMIKQYKYSRRSANCIKTDTSHMKYVFMTLPCMARFSKQINLVLNRSIYYGMFFQANVLF